MGFARNEQGGLATTFALIFPVVAMLGCGALDVWTVYRDHTALQDAADATALAMAKQIGLSSDAGLQARAADYVRAELGSIADDDAVSTATSASASTEAITVTLAGRRQSFFANLFPPGGWRLRAKATATAMGSVPLCVLSYGVAGGYNLHVANQSLLTAPGCLVQSNGNITVDGGAKLSSGLAQAVGAAKGPITPSAQAGAPSISDPFSSLAVRSPVQGCNPYNVTYLSSGTNYLNPGVHCGNFVVQNGALLQLLPGEHYFVKGALQLQGAASLSGADVVLVFDKASHFSFQDQAKVDLSGRTSGIYAGFVVATTRLNTGTFSISSTSAEKLEGIIYIPSATLNVTGAANKVAQQSAWTVIVAQAIQLSGSANLVINSDYATSGVPVPAGVGDKIPRAVKLAQ